MCAPSSVGAIEPVGMTNASTTNARKMNARMNATRMDSTVSLMFPSGCGRAGGLGGAGEGDASAVPSTAMWASLRGNEWGKQGFNLRRGAAMPRDTGVPPVRDGLLVGECHEALYGCWDRPHGRDVHVTGPVLPAPAVVRPYTGR